MNRIFEKLYMVKWLKLLKASTKCQPNVINFKLFSNFNCPRESALPLLNETLVRLLLDRPKFDCTNKRFCRKLARDRKPIKLEVGANKAKKDEKIDRILSNSESAQSSPQITWKAMLKAKRKTKPDGSTKKTQSEFNMRETQKSGMKTRTSPQLNLSASKPVEKSPLTMSSYGNPPVNNNSIVSKIPKIIPPGKLSVKMNFADSKVVRNEENKAPTTSSPEKKVITKQPEKVETQSKTEPLIQDSLRNVKFTFVVDNRNDIPPPKDINLLNQFQKQVANAPVQIDNKSNLQEFVNRPKINIKSLQPLRSLETVAKTFKLNPLVKQNEVEVKKVKQVQNQLFGQLKIKQQGVTRQSSAPVTPNIKTNVRVPVPSISDNARATMRKTQIFNTQDLMLKPAKNLPQNPSVTILNKAKFPDITPVIPPPPPNKDKRPPNSMLAKSSTFTLDPKPTPPEQPKKMEQPKEPTQQQTTEVKFEQVEPEQQQEKLAQAAKNVQSKLPQPLSKFNVDNDENELLYAQINKKLADEIISDKCSLPQVIEPDSNSEHTSTKDSCWKLMNGTNLAHVLEHIKPFKKKSKIPVRNINEHPLLLESGDKVSKEGDSANDYSKSKIVE